MLWTLNSIAPALARMISPSFAIAKNLSSNPLVVPTLYFLIENFSPIMEIEIETPLYYFCIGKKKKRKVSTENRENERRMGSN